MTWPYLATFLRYSEIRVKYYKCFLPKVYLAFQQRGDRIGISLRSLAPVKSSLPTVIMRHRLREGRFWHSIHTGVWRGLQMSHYTLCVTR